MMTENNNNLPPGDYLLRVAVRGSNIAIPQATMVEVARKSLMSTTRVVSERRMEGRSDKRGRE